METEATEQLPPAPDLAAESDLSATKPQREAEEPAVSEPEPTLLVEPAPSQPFDLTETPQDTPFTPRLRSGLPKSIKPAATPESSTPLTPEPDLVAGLSTNVPADLEETE